jgi:hypothetical protein
VDPDAPLAGETSESIITAEIAGTPLNGLNVMLAEWIA